MKKYFEVEVPFDIKAEDIKESLTSKDHWTVSSYMPDDIWKVREIAGPSTDASPTIEDGIVMIDDYIDLLKICSTLPATSRGTALAALLTAKVKLLKYLCKKTYNRQ